MKLPRSNDEKMGDARARAFVEKILSPENIEKVDAVRAQHWIIEAGQVLLEDRRTRKLGVRLFLVASWLIPQAERFQGKEEDQH